MIDRTIMELRRWVSIRRCYSFPWHSMHLQDIQILQHEARAVKKESYNITECSALAGQARRIRERHTIRIQTET